MVAEGDGCLEADSVGRPRHDNIWRLREAEFGDFDLRLEFQAFRLSPENGGVQLRSRYEEAAGWLDGPRWTPPAQWRTGMNWDET